MVSAQRAARRLFTDHVDVVRVVPTKDAAGFDGDTEEPVWSGPCKIQSFRPYETQLSSAGRAVVTQRTEIHVPVDAGAFQVGDICRVRGHRYALRVAGLDEKTHQSAQRLLADQISNPGR